MNAPIELRLRDGGRILEIDWDRATPSRLSAPRLRAACRCAGCTRAQADSVDMAIDPAMAITAIELVGGYAANLRFSDGHARGIFPWSYLREIDESDAITCSTATDRAGSVAPDPVPKDAA